MQDADFLDEDTPFSSFAYRIDAMSRSALVFDAIASNPLCSIKLARADAALANFFLQLPESKRNPLDRHGNMDEYVYLNL